ncbi:MAG: SIMPL domain-containing protein [Oscillospiraceae bacterium]|jgi:hypothetical protein
MNESKSRSVSYIIVAALLVVGFLVSAYIVTDSFVRIKSGSDIITVTGSARKQITSDLIVWTGSFSAKAETLTGAYALLEENKDKVQAYLAKQGLEDEIVFSSISTSIHYLINDYGVYTGEIDSYELFQNVTITSGDIDKITDISRNITELINEGVPFQSLNPQYIYTKIADLKVEMLAAATEDAVNRARMMAENAGSKLGRLKSASMGVFQITPRFSNDISDYGINDTSSLEKDITAVVNCQFYVDNS